MRLHAVLGSPNSRKALAVVNAYYDRMRDVEHWARTAPADQTAIGRKPKAA